MKKEQLSGKKKGDTTVLKSANKNIFVLTLFVRLFFVNASLCVETETRTSNKSVVESINMAPKFREHKFVRYQEVKADTHEEK